MYWFVSAARATTLAYKNPDSPPRTCAQMQRLSSSCASHPMLDLHVPLLRGVHFRVTLAPCVLGGPGRRGKRRIHCRASLQHQAFRAEEIADYGKHLVAQIVRFQKMPEAKDSGLIRKPHHAFI